MLTGTPGVGKHSVADQIIRMSSEWSIVDVNEVALKAGLYEYEEEKEEEENSTTNNNYNYRRTSNTTKYSAQVDTDKLAAIVKDRLDSTGNHIIVGHLAPYVTPRDSVMFAVILRRDPYQLAKVYKKRKYKQAKILENAGSEVLGTIAYDTFCASYVKTGQFDTTDKQAKEVAAEILGALHRMYHGDYSSKPGEIQHADGTPWTLVDWLHKDRHTTKNHNDKNQKNNTNTTSITNLKILEDFISGWPHTKH